MHKESTQFVTTMPLASPGCAWRHQDIGAKRSESLAGNYFAAGSCVGGLV